MNDEDIVAALAEALEDRFSYATSYATVIVDWDEEAAALLPVVRRVAEQRAAERETQVLTLISRLLDKWPNATSLRRAIRQVLREETARAAALTATPNHGRNAT